MPHCAVVGDGETPDRTALDGAWPGWSDDLGFVVAADAGAIGAEALGLRVDLVVGDGDSLGDAGIARVRDSGIETECIDRELIRRQQTFGRKEAEDVRAVAVLGNFEVRALACGGLLLILPR